MDSASPAVLHVTQPTTAGVGILVRQLAEIQASWGWRVLVASPAVGPLAGWVTSFGGEHLDWQAGRSPGGSVPDEVRRLRRIIDAAQPDLVHLHSAKAGLAGRLALRGRLPTVFQPHGWSFLAATGAQRRAAQTWERVAARRWTHALVTVSAGERALGEQARIRARWFQVPYGIDLDRFQPTDAAAAREKLGLTPAPLAVCLGRICRQKGQDLLLAAWPNVLEQVPHATLAMVGEPEGDYVATPDVPAVVWAGPTDNPQDWYAAADIVVVPSRWEGSPLVAREAMACGRSVVISDIPGVRDEIPVGAGAIIDMADPVTVGQAVSSRLLDPKRTDAEGRYGFEYATQNFDRVVWAMRITEVYSDICDVFESRSP